MVKAERGASELSGTLLQFEVLVGQSKLFWYANWASSDPNLKKSFDVQ